MLKLCFFLLIVLFHQIIYWTSNIHQQIQRTQTFMFLVLLKLNAAQEPTRESKDLLEDAAILWSIKEGRCVHHWQFKYLISLLYNFQSETDWLVLQQTSSFYCERNIAWDSAKAWPLITLSGGLAWWQRSWKTGEGRQQRLARNVCTIVMSELLKGLLHHRLQGAETSHRDWYDG